MAGGRKKERTAMASNGETTIPGMVTNFPKRKRTIEREEGGPAVVQGDKGFWTRKWEGKKNWLYERSARIELKRSWATRFEKKVKNPLSGGKKLPMHGTILVGRTGENTLVD